MLWQKSLKSKNLAGSCLLLKRPGINFSLVIIRGLERANETASVLVPTCWNHPKRTSTPATSRRISNLCLCCLQRARSPIRAVVGVLIPVHLGVTGLERVLTLSKLLKVVLRLHLLRVGACITLVIPALRHIHSQLNCMRTNLLLWRNAQRSQLVLQVLQF